MSMLSLSQWLATDQGRYVSGWELDRVGRMVSDIFGFNALQIGMPQLDFLAENRIPLRQKVGEPDDNGAVDVRCALPALPFANASIDLVVLAHVLEFHEHPHQLLREVERVLIAEGQLVIIGFNPFSLWGLRRGLPRCPDGAPWDGRYLSLPRIKDWLQLLSFEIDRGHFGRYAPPFRSAAWLDRCRWMEKAGDRWWPVAGGVYAIRAVKRVHGIRLVKPKWKATPTTAKALNPVARREQPHG
jgi:SAM-dependent methyltransferase